MSSITQDMKYRQSLLNFAKDMVLVKLPESTIRLGLISTFGSTDTMEV